jgi:putative Holliday junction resolvase
MSLLTALWLLSCRRGLGNIVLERLLKRQGIMRSLGLDIGDKRIGVALSDPYGILASPYTIIHRQHEPADVEALVGIIRQQEVTRVIVGLPRSMDGSLGEQAEKVKVFTEKLAAKIEVPVEFRDERLSTVSARRLMKEARVKGAKHDDANAAALILQGYLDEAS